MSLYFHIPFCSKKCTYCDFHFSTRYHSYYNDMIKSIINEFDIKKNRLQNEIKSIYFGGGTPGLLKINDLSLIIDESKNLKISENAEITLEVNPENITKENILLWKSIGINRLSIGVQSFDDNILKWMNRSHTSKETLNSIYLANNFGFNNINIDLIFSIPNTDKSYWKKQLSFIKNLPINHISAYQLTVEKKTHLYHQIKNKTISILGDVKITNQFLYTHDFLENIGFEHYEISNYAKDQKYSKHNLSYWMGYDYLGIGPSAHSLHFPYRYWNINNNIKYIKSINSNIIPEQKEELSKKNIFNEKIMLSLRTKWGLNINELSKILNFTSDFSKNLSFYIDKNLITTKDNTIKLTKQGLLFADKIASDLFYV